VQIAFNYLLITPTKILNLTVYLAVISRRKPAVLTQKHVKIIESGLICCPSYN